MPPSMKNVTDSNPSPPTPGPRRQPMQPNAAARYQTQQIMTASPARLVSMLYDRALRALRDTVRAIEEGDIRARYTHNEKATEIITHLWGTLDTDKGGEIARNLSELYRFMLKRLSVVNIRNDAGAAREVIGLLEPIAASWRELAANGGNAPAPRAPQSGGTPYAPGPEQRSPVAVSA